MNYISKSKPPTYSVMEVMVVLYNKFQKKSSKNKDMNKKNFRCIIRQLNLICNIKGGKNYGDDKRTKERGK